MTYTVRNCLSYSDTTMVSMQEFDSTGRLTMDADLCGFQGPGRIRKAVKRAFGELLWDVKQGFVAEVFMRGSYKGEKS